MAIQHDRALRELVDVEHGRVSRQVYVNDEIFRQEQERIFMRAWLFVGHESMVANPGDFAASRMGAEEVLLVRDQQDKIHVFLNTCRHRGMKVCRYDRGNALVFTCPFHAWTYDTAGRLVGMGFAKEAYPPTFDKRQWPLKEVAQLCNYYGSIWATWDPRAPAFEEYLGPIAPSVRHCFQSSDGEDNGVEFFMPIMRWRIPTNWKFPAFSFAGDGTHAAMTHLSVNAAAIGPQGDQEGGDRHLLRAEFPRRTHDMVLPEYGHGGNMTVFGAPGVPPYRDTWQTEPGVDEYFRAARDRKAAKVDGHYLTPGGHGGGHFNVFPNVTIDSWRIMHWHPLAPGVTESWRLFQVDRNAPKVVKDAIRHYAMRYCGPMGCTESDDMENWNYAYPASKGAVAQTLDYPFVQGLGMTEPVEGYPGFISRPTRQSEVNQRARLHRWLEFMEADSWDDLFPVRKPSA
jgi:phenylpropionate dioxygenase-like ring-hydroxylating dioxygenase large terminal subunit